MSIYHSYASLMHVGVGAGVWLVGAGLSMCGLVCVDESEYVWLVGVGTQSLSLNDFGLCLYASLMCVGVSASLRACGLCEKVRECGREGKRVCVCVREREAY